MLDFDTQQSNSFEKSRKTAPNRPMTTGHLIFKDLRAPKNFPDALDTMPNLSAYCASGFRQDYERRGSGNWSLVTSMNKDAGVRFAANGACDAVI